MVAFVVDDLVAWLTGVLADAGRQRLTTLVLGTPQKRALRQAASAAVQQTVTDLVPTAGPQADELTRVIREVFKPPAPSGLIDGNGTLLESLLTCVISQFGVLDVVTIAGTQAGSPEPLSIPGRILAQILVHHLVTEIRRLAAEGGPLEPLGNQLNHDIGRLEIRQGHRMLRDVEGRIDRITRHLGMQSLGVSSSFPLGTLKMKPAYWATVRTIRERTSKLQDRESELAMLAAFASSSQGYRWLVGAPWAGKTSLMAEAAVELRDKCDVVCYFLSRREADADSSRFLTVALPQLAWLLEEESAAADVHQFRALWQRASERAERIDRPLILVVDGLDEDLRPPGLASVAALLPADAGGRTHVLVSSRPHPDFRDELAPGHPLARIRLTELQSFSGSLQLEVRARQEINELLNRDDNGLAADILGLLAAAGGPMTAGDLTELTRDALRTEGVTRRIRRLLSVDAARSLQRSSQGGDDRYQFAHESLLAHARNIADLNDIEFGRRIRLWADRWQAGGWHDGQDGGEAPRYLLDSYPSSLDQEPERLKDLVTDPGWVDSAIRQVGVDSVIASLRRAVAADLSSNAVAEMLATVRGQVHLLRHPMPVTEPGYVLRQLCLQAAELGADHLTCEFRARLRSQPGLGLIPVETTRRVSPALSADLGRHSEPIDVVVALGDRGVITGGYDGRVLVWDLAAPGAGAVELGRHAGSVRAVVVVGDGRVVSGGYDGRVLMWDPAAPGAAPTELGRQAGAIDVVVVLADGRLVTGGDDGRVLVWDPAAPGAGPAELGRHARAVRSAAVLADGRLVTGGDDGRVLVWDPAAPGAAPAQLGRQAGAIDVVVVLADGRLVTGGDDGRVLVWDPAAPGAAPAELGHHDDRVRSAAVLADGRLVTGGDDGRVLVWDPAVPGVGPAQLGRHERAVRAVCVLQEDRVISGGYDGRVLVWDPGAGSAEQNRQDDAIDVAVVLEDGHLVTGGDDGRVLVWKLIALSDGPIELGRHDDWVRTAIVLGDGRVVSGGYDGRVLVWDPAAPGAAPAELGRHARAVRAAAVLADGRLVTGGDDGRVLVWDPAAPGAGPVELGCHMRSIGAVAVLADGRVVSGGYDGRVLVWDPAAPGAGPVELGCHMRSIGAVAVLADGRVVSGGYDGRVLVWDPAAPGAGPVELGYHADWVRAVAILKDDLIVTSGYDGQVLVWSPSRPGSRLMQLGCSAAALAANPLIAGSQLIIVHEGTGLSVWSLVE